jgi:hypothetical protein
VNVSPSLVLLGLLTSVTSAAAQNTRMELSVTPRNVSFTLGDPDTSPEVAAFPIIMTYRIRGLPGNRPWQLTVLASGDLMSGPSRIDISAVRWTATPAPPFRNGTLNHSVAQIVAAGTGNVNPTQLGLVTFRMQNSWTYDSGAYSQTIIFTLSAP